MHRAIVLMVGFIVGCELQHPDRDQLLLLLHKLEKSVGKIYDDKVDLTSRLPADIEGLEIHFVIKGPHLYIYLRKH